MKTKLCLAVALLLNASLAASPADEPGFQPIFDGKSFDGWKAADMSFWSIEDGALTAKITKERPLPANLYLIWQGGELADFELKLKSRVFGSPKINNGFQFRSRELPNHDLMGYQMDNNTGTPWLVRLYEEHGRHTLAWRGERTVIDASGKMTKEPITEAQGEAAFKLEDWHEYHLICVGNKLTLKVNGKLMAETTDNDPVHFAAQGILAMQLHTGPPTVAQFKDIRLKVLKPAFVKANPQPTETKAGGSLADKTLVAWAAPANLTQKGGSVLTIDDRQSHFDGIVFGERAAARWMAGSDGYRRTQLKQDSWPAETADANTLVQVAIVYRGNEVTVYRDGKEYSCHTIKEPQRFGADSVVMIGRRHMGNNDFFEGAVADARIYDRALTVEQIAKLKVKAPSEPRPWAWWTFDDLMRADRMGRFTATRLEGGAKVADGRLILDGKKAEFLAAQAGSGFDSVSPPPMPPSLASLPKLPDDIAVVRRFRNHLLGDPHRPTYHFVIPEDYAGPFDPNGAIFWRGRYHLFYIYQENRVHCFGHISSVDLVHWRQHPTPLFPTDTSPDRGMFSGNCFINKRGEATMLFHGVGAGNCIATSNDDNLDRWTKLPSNPIIPNPKGREPYASWDPHGWLEGDTYYGLFGGNPGSGKPPSTFKATELDGWRYVGPFLSREMPDVAANEDISCPDFFKLGNKRVLVCIAHNRGNRYYVGEWKNEQFHPEIHERMSWVDNTYFAPESLEAPDGRRILWGWIFDQRSPATKRASGWSGELSLPRVLTLGDDNRLRYQPIEELKRLRYNEQTQHNIAIAAGKEVVLNKIAGNTIELELQIEPQDAKQVGVKVCRSPDREEETLLFYDAAEQKLKLDTNKSSLAEGPKKIEAAPFALKPGELLTLRVFVDRSVVEVFANDRQAALRRIYPCRPDSVGVSVFANGGAAKVRQVKAWQMAPSNPY
ncbi:MAG: GH32 C-terminal domain-containing protein [Verrucomicrobia bacterium]|nr:GH32 C-terminal domain-containing protein [Verrucomicrobiota bacterium]